MLKGCPKTTEKFSKKYAKGLLKLPKSYAITAKKFSTNCRKKPKMHAGSSKRETKLET